jgi:hypothetical protein
VSKHPGVYLLSCSLVPLHDYLTLVPEAIAALEVRESALNLLFTLQDELASKQAQLEQASKVDQDIGRLCRLLAPRHLLISLACYLPTGALPTLDLRVACRTPLTSAQPSFRPQWPPWRSRYGGARATMTESSHATRWGLGGGGVCCPATCGCPGTCVPTGQCL